VTAAFAVTSNAFRSNACSPLRSRSTSRTFALQSAKLHEMSTTADDDDDIG